MVGRAKSKDLVEVFGYEPDDTTSSVRSLWRLGACPFTNKACTKANHDGSITYGTCSVTSAYGDCIICPNRLYENNYAALRRIATNVFGDDAEFVLFEEYVRRRDEAGIFAVALGQNSGREVKIGKNLSMDWVLAKVCNGALVEYAGIEVQSIDITGNYRDGWHAYRNAKPGVIESIPSSGHGLNWANVHKRLIPQIIRKGRVYASSEMVKSGLHFVVPEIVYRKFEEIIGADIQIVAGGAPDIITIHTYSLSPAMGHGKQRSLLAEREISVSLDEFAQRFISGPNLPSGMLLDSAVMRVLGLENALNRAPSAP
ncbi:MAG: restriction endonuclease [Betaproteobacteria bacterium]|nr:restriction endonuclease [Betaproteobacteria bacterium]